MVAIGRITFLALSLLCLATADLDPEPGLLPDILAGLQSTTNTINSILTNGGISSSTKAIGPMADMIISNALVSPDGFTRSAVLANGIFPGPPVTGYKGNRFRMNVIDQLTDSRMYKSTSIHWHGLFQKGSSWADGPSFVNQFAVQIFWQPGPITSGHSFLYDFTVPDQAGTFWYHSHLATQYCDGLRGPMVVYDIVDPNRWMYDVDDESTIITLADWYHSPSRAAGKFPDFDSTLINGLGRYAGGPTSQLSVINVVWFRRYRFRLVSISCEPNFMFRIQGHRMTIIEADAINTKPLEVDSIHIFAGQRYSFILNANQPVANYWIQANPNRGTTGFQNGINSAILRYIGAKNEDPLVDTIPTSVSPMKETNLVPLTDPAAAGQPFAGGADVAINLQLNIIFGQGYTVNGLTYKSPGVPTLLQILSGASDPRDLLPGVISLPANKVIELSIPAFDLGGPHPMHLHGHTFDVIRSAGSKTYNYANPIKRDVVSIGSAADNDNVTIRFKTDNSGVWFMHCHIDWHLESGLAVVFAEDIGHIKTNVIAPPAWSELCPLYNALRPADQ